MEETINQKEFVAPNRTFTVELLVGVFMLIGVGCFAFLAINIAQMKFLQSGYYQLRAEFGNISGLELGAPVEIAGVPIGEVKEIALKDTAAVVTMAIRNDVNLRDDDIASIRTKGIIGDRYVRISPGSSDQIVPHGGAIKDTESTVDIEEVIGKFIHRMGSDDKKGE